MWLRLKKYDKILLFFFVSAIAASTLIWLFEERFDESRWQSNPARRYKMADDLIDQKLLIGKTKDEVISLLGHPEFFDENTDDYITYAMGQAPSFKRGLRDRLVVVFKDGLVIEVIHAKEAD